MTSLLLLAGRRVDTAKCVSVFICVLVALTLGSIELTLNLVRDMSWSYIIVLDRP